MVYSGGWRERAQAKKRKRVEEKRALRQRSPSFDLKLDEQFAPPRMRQVTRVRPKVPLYKYVPLRHVPGFQAGSVRIGTVLNYRAMPGERGDSLEGTAFNYIAKKHFDYVGANDTAVRSKLQQFNIDIIECTDVTVMNYGRQYDAVDHYVFCLTTDATFTPEEPSRMFRLRSLEELERLVQRLRPDLGPVETSMVTYGNRSSDVFADGFLAADPFLKPVENTWEAEARMAWPGSGGANLEPFNLSHPDIGALFELVDRPDLE